MAKLKAPLLSLGASGAIGKALVFFPWKGLDVVREYVVPANPKSTKQNLVRLYFHTAVDQVHASQVMADHPLDQDDQTAYALKGSLMPTPRTWFNTIIKELVYNWWRDWKASIFRDGITSELDKKLTVWIYSSDILAGNIVAGTFWYGTSKSNLINAEGANIDVATHQANTQLTGLANGVKYFWQFRPTPAAWNQTRSGIYYGTPKA